MRAPSGAFLVVAMVGLAVPAAAATDPLADAIIHYKAGESYFEQKDFGSAMREFRESYRLSKRGLLLYNIALCAEKLKDWDSAIEALKTYRDLPEAQRERTSVDDKLRKLDALAKQKHEQEVAKTAAPPTEKPPDLAPSTATSGYRTYAWPVFGVGLLTLAASLVVGLLAHGKYSDLQMACGADGKTCPGGFESGRDSGTTLAHASDGLLGVGLAAVAVSVVLFVIPRSEKPRPISFAPTVGPASAGLAATVSF